MINEDWQVLLSLLPKDWREQAVLTSAMKGLRKDKSEENLLRTLLIHLAGGFSLRETAVRARQAQLADLSDVALLKRLRKSKDWLASMCNSMLRDRGVSLDSAEDFEVRLFDATTVTEPGKTGSLWRIHYSVGIPSLECDFFKVTAAKGQGSGESLRQYPVKAGDHIIADRGYSTPSGIEYVSGRRAYVLLRISPHNLPALDWSRHPLRWPELLGQIRKSGQARAWRVLIPSPHGRYVGGRICAVRKTEEAIRLAHKRLKARASRKGQQLQPETLLHAEYVVVFTTFEESSFTPAQVMNWYRVRWQIELVFKRFKQIAQLGHLPKYDDDSAKAWLYGKMFLALLTEKLIAHARSISPWGVAYIENTSGEPLA